MFMALHCTGYVDVSESLVIGAFICATANRQFRFLILVGKVSIDFHESIKHHFSFSLSLEIQPKQNQNHRVNQYDYQKNPLH